MSKQYIIEAKDEFGWYDHADFATFEEAKNEINSYFDTAMIKNGDVRLVDTEAMSYVEII